MSSSFMTELFYGPIGPTWIADPRQFYCDYPDFTPAWEEAPAPTQIADPRQFYYGTPYYTPAWEEAPAPTQIAPYGTGWSEERCMRTVDFMVPVCCEKCERDLKKTLLKCDDVEGVTCDQWTKKVSVTSCIPPNKLLKRLQKFKARSTFWSDRSN